ncbi:hypothetical protein BMF94_7088 [Rhodotorula taiwanensis]|uniref:Osmotin, thaumatin-like protein n=1 Tax=Rhodotorula taiwanensis TaxID=741276 RepID=A0A2S5AZD7_9BASI|nr:hypothetical protein BMF94_7088 [Rhodotorula taiwanensis]
MLLLSSLFAAACALATAQRQFVVVNNCKETLWPALTNQGDPSTRTYSGIRGWEAPPGHVQQLSLPSNWNGRIWPRRHCQFDGTGRGSCLSGNCAGGLNCGDNEGDFLSLGEWNLNSWGGLDFYDLSFVAGFNIPMSIAPDGCQALTCSQDLNTICPDERMRQRDAAGNVIGCKSACMAGINAGIPSMNCCSGIYESIPACVPSGVDYYDIFKPVCPSAYWYRRKAHLSRTIASTARDQRDGNPQVDWACQAGTNPKYTVTLGPTDGAKVGKTNVAVDNESASAAGGKSSSATSTATGAAKTVGSASAISSASSSSASSDAASATSTAEATSGSADGKILGLSKPIFFSIVAVAGAIVVGVIACFACRRSRSRSAVAATATVPVADNELGMSDSEEEQREKRNRRRYSEDGSPLLRR